MEAIQKSYSTQRLLKVKVFRITSYLGSTILGRFKVNFQTYHCEKIVVALIHPRVVPQTFSTHIYMLYYALCTCMFDEREDSKEETWHANSAVASTCCLSISHFPTRPLAMGHPSSIFTTCVF